MRLDDTQLDYPAYRAMALRAALEQARADIHEMLHRVINDRRAWKRLIDTIARIDKTLAAVKASDKRCAAAHRAEQPPRAIVPGRQKELPLA